VSGAVETKGETYVDARLLRRAVFRAVGVAAGFALFRGTFLLTLSFAGFLGLACGALSLLEPWVAKAETVRSVLRRASVGFVVACLAYAVCFLHAVYFESAWSEGSVAGGLGGIAEVPGKLTNVPPGTLPLLSGIVIEIFSVQAFGISCATFLAWMGIVRSESVQVRTYRSAAFLFWALLVGASAGCDGLGWVGFVLVRNGKPADEPLMIALFMGFCVAAVGFALAGCTSAGVAGLGVVTRVSEWIDARFWPRETELDGTR
jgi:hypothetical protein